MTEDPSRRRLVIIGMDGASYPLVRTWLDEGGLPNLGRLVEGGSLSLLRSTNPPVTFPAIPSFSTGKGPGGHGVSCFFRPKLDSSLGLVSSRDLRGEFWDLHGMWGMRKVIVNLPLTYPAKPTNGIVVAGTLTPDKEDPGFVHPPERDDELKDLLQGYSIDVEERYLVGGEEDFVEACERVMRARTDLFLGLLGREPWDLAIVYYTILDRVQHHILGRDDDEWTSRAYSSLDGEVGRVTAALDHGTHVLVFSDHGFGRSKGRFLPNAWLEARGHLRYARGRGRPRLLRLSRRISSSRALSSGLRRLPKRLVRSAVDRVARSSGSFDLGTVDWDSTTAYATIGGVHLNEDVVEDGEAVLSGIAEGLKGLRDEDGDPLDVRVWRREEVYSGDFLDRMPHLVYSVEGFAYEPFPAFETGEGLRTFRGEFKGWHREEGVLVASGPDFARGPTPEVSIIDIAPTVLHLLGQPVPDNMDGRVVRELFREGSAPFEGEVKFIPGAFDEAMRLRGAIQRIAHNGGSR